MVNVELPPHTILAERYRILEKIAQGGMGAVYKAEDLHFQQSLVAIKVVSESAIDRTEREQVLTAFKREAKLLARLSHPHMVRVTEHFTIDDHHYMVMEFIMGSTLAQLLKWQAEPFPESLVLSWANQLCDVLAYLHAQVPSIIYRDMKPANIMVIDGTGNGLVKLIDFGIARFYKPGQPKDTLEFGTSGYAPPEQYGRAQTDARSDIYGLAATLHHLFTLRDPASALFEFKPIQIYNPMVSASTATAIAKALTKSPMDRYASIQEFRAALFSEH